ncbi:MAG: hypothetical protein IKO96_02695, partial [Spirochaetales bacterium]|nr:hypothetical protein [Spirochaetales bacterium]
CFNSKLNLIDILFALIKRFFIGPQRSNNFIKCFLFFLDFIRNTVDILLLEFLLLSNLLILDIPFCNFLIFSLFYFVKTFQEKCGKTPDEYSKVLAADMPRIMSSSVSSVLGTEEKIFDIEQSQDLLAKLGESRRKVC